MTSHPTRARRVATREEPPLETSVVYADEGTASRARARLLPSCGYFRDVASRRARDAEKARRYRARHRDERVRAYRTFVPTHAHAERVLVRCQPDPTSGCLLYPRRTPEGYGCLNIGSLSVLAHRVVYAALVGPIPEGFEIDHVRARGCTSRACCNVDHLEAVVHRENVLRGTSLVAVNAAKTHCDHGHEFTVANTYVRWRSGTMRRECRECRSEASARYQVRRCELEVSLG